MKDVLKYIIILLSLLCINSGRISVYAQDYTKDNSSVDDRNIQNNDEDTLNYTYIGPLFSIGITNVEYTDWFETGTEKKTMSGTFYSGGAIITIFSGNYCGDFQTAYVYNTLDYNLCFIEMAVTGKYLYPFNDTLSAGTGLGFYFTTPPSNMDYNGSAGVILPLTAIFNITPEIKLFIGINFKYGNFGIGEDTSSVSAGINTGLTFKVGRI